MAVADRNTSVETVMEKAMSEMGETTGAVTADDLEYLSSFRSLRMLDLKDACVYEIGASAFRAHPELEEIDLPDTVTVIGQQAFYNCRKLKTIEIPASVVEIGSGAFVGCTSLKTILEIRAVYPPDYSVDGDAGDSFNGLDTGKNSSVTSIKVPYGCAEDYRLKEGWKAFDIVESSKHVLEVDFASSGSLMEAAYDALEAEGLEEEEVTDLIVTNPEGVQLQRAEDINNGLQKHFLYAATIDLSGTEFEDNKCNANHFRNRISLKYINLPDSTNNIGGTAFAGCKNLRELYQ